MNIGLDYDDVIVDTYEPYFAYAQKYMIENLKRNSQIIDNGDINSSAYCTNMHGWTQAEEDDFWFNNYWKEIEESARFKTFAKDIIEKFRKEGNKIIIITSRNQDEAQIMYNQLEQEGIVVDDIIINAKNKGKIAKENDIDVFVDDNYKNCKEVYEQGIKSYIMDIRTNRNLNDANIPRVYSWPHIYYEISKLY